MKNGDSLHAILFDLDGTLRHNHPAGFDTFVGYLADLDHPLSQSQQHRGEVAERWQHKNGSGEIGMVASVTQAFCRDCTRARLSAEGSLYTCLFGIKGFDLRAMVHGGASDAEIAQAVGRVWRVRSDRYSEIRSEATVGLPKVEMSHIGG
ncbi:MAG: hypothetical protein HY872_11065 [Chloroflexi bacterium]|nr:hypothetical protein [Chloroflexota bacterium]MBI5828308.1 hypothetical protein [Chloroflexota bacterium]